MRSEIHFFQALALLGKPLSSGFPNCNNTLGPLSQPFYRLLDLWTNIIAKKTDKKRPGRISLPL